jgi:hypothetical protein
MAAAEFPEMLRSEKGSKVESDMMVRDKKTLRMLIFHIWE